MPKKTSDEEIDEWADDVERQLYKQRAEAASQRPPCVGHEE